MLMSIHTGCSNPGIKQYAVNRQDILAFEADILLAPDHLNARGLRISLYDPCNKDPLREMLKDFPEEVVKEILPDARRSRTSVSPNDDTTNLLNLRDYNGNVRLTDYLDGASMSWAGGSPSDLPVRKAELMAEKSLIARAYEWRIVQIMLGQRKLGIEFEGVAEDERTTATVYVPLNRNFYVDVLGVPKLELRPTEANGRGLFGLGGKKTLTAVRWLDPNAMESKIIKSCILDRSECRMKVEFAADDYAAARYFHKIMKRPPGEHSIRIGL